MNKKIVIGTSVGVLAATIIVVMAFTGQGNKIVKKLTKKITTGNSGPACPIDGLPTTQEKADRKPLGIMVENLAQIRPQSGLSKADIVFEALAEGGITRFLAVYGHNDVDKIGPVRSARPYYVALATGFDAVYAHAGGSTEGLQAIKDYGTDDFGYDHMAAYWRQSGIGAPHNLFTSTKKLRSESEKAGLKSVDYDGFEFDKEKIKGKPAKKIEVNFSSGDYQVEWKYDKKANKYKRFNGGIAHTDANTGKQIAPTNIVVVRAQTSMFNALTLNIKIIGDGNGYLFRDGKQIPIKWKKDSAASQIVFSDQDDNAIEFNPGQIWVEVVRPETSVSSGGL